MKMRVCEYSKYDSYHFLDFFVEVQETIIKAITENETLDNAKLQINSVKFAHDATFAECRSLNNGLTLQVQMVY